MSQWATESSKNKPPHRLPSLVCFPRSHWDTEHQFWGAGPQPAIPAAPSQSLQTLLRLPGQVLWIPLWRQCVWGLQGRTLRLKWPAVVMLRGKSVFTPGSNQTSKPFPHSWLRLVLSLRQFTESLVALCHWWSVIMVATLFPSFPVSFSCPKALSISVKWCHWT